MEASDTVAGTTYELITPDLRSSADPPYLVSFWYHTLGDGIGSLDVYEYDGLSQHGPIWRLAAEDNTVGEGTLTELN